MTTTASKLQKIIDTKEDLKIILSNNDITPPVKFSEYPQNFNTIINNFKSALNNIDRITVSADITVEQLNFLFKVLPDCNNLNRNELIGTCQVTDTTNGLNVRSGPGADLAGYSKIGKLQDGDRVTIYGSETETGGTVIWYKIKEYRTDLASPLEEKAEFGYVSSSYMTTEEVFIYAKEIDICYASETVQKTCNRSVIESKGWLLSSLYAADTPGSGEVDPPPVEPTTNELTFEFDNCYTENYSDSNYTNYLGVSTSPHIRQGYYSYYYRGNIRFKDATLQEVKEILNNSTVNSMELYLERANTAHGPSTPCKLFLYACDSTGTNSDILIENSGSLLRGGSKWIILDSTIVNGFVSGKYDHFKIYKASTAIDYYQRLEANAKLKINYTA